MICVICGKETGGSQDTCSGTCWVLSARMEYKAKKGRLQGNIGKQQNNLTWEGFEYVH